MNIVNKYGKKQRFFGKRRRIFEFSRGSKWKSTDMRLEIVKRNKEKTERKGGRNYKLSKESRE